MNYELWESHRDPFTLNAKYFSVPMILCEIQIQLALLKEGDVKFCLACWVKCHTPTSNVNQQRVLIFLDNWISADNGG